MVKMFMPHKSAAFDSPNSKWAYIRALGRRATEQHSTNHGTGVSFPKIHTPTYYVQHTLQYYYTTNTRVGVVGLSTRRARGLHGSGSTVRVFVVRVLITRAVNEDNGGGLSPCPRAGPKRSFWP